MVVAALDKISNENIQISDEAKAKMVNNLLVTICASKESQPVTRIDVD